MTVAARPFGYVGSQPRLRTWLQIGFWVVVGIILLTLTGAQFGPAATISILAITITKATPITLGALAGICSERTGVVNIGIEGLMLTSAFTGFMAGVYTHNLGIALVAAIASGAPMALTAIVLVLLLHVALFRTRWGLRTRAVGEHPLAADTVGVNVNRLRYYNVVLGGALAGLAGAYFTLESVPHFEPLMTNGRGFIALAAMIFGKWTPFGAWGAALLFGVAEAIPTAMQLQGINIPFQIVGLLPYVLTIVVVAGAVGRATPPAADGIPYVRS